MCCVLLLKAAKEEESRKNTSAQLLAQNEIEGHLPYACALKAHMALTALPWAQILSNGLSAAPQDQPSPVLSVDTSSDSLTLSSQQPKEATKPRKQKR